jgi:hypothetical protein
LHGTLALVTPPLKPSMRNMVLNALPQARRDFGFNLTQRRKHRLLFLRRIQPRKISL